MHLDVIEGPSGLQMRIIKPSVRQRVDFNRRNLFEPENLQKVSLTSKHTRAFSYKRYLTLIPNIDTAVTMTIIETVNYCSDPVVFDPLCDKEMSGQFRC